jgi:hypothetical protein
MQSSLLLEISFYLLPASLSSCLLPNQAKLGKVCKSTGLVQNGSRFLVDLDGEVDNWSRRPQVTSSFQRDMLTIQYSTVYWFVIISNVYLQSMW